VLAFIVGGQRYGLYVGAGLGSMLIVLVFVAVFWPD